MKAIRTAVVAAGAMLASLPALAQEIFTMRFASFAPPTAYTNVEVLEPMFQRWKEKSDGRLNWLMFAGGSLGKSPAAYRQMVLDGVADAGIIVPSYTRGEFPDNDFVELPLVTDTTLQATLGFQRMFEAGHLSGYDNMKVWAFYTTPVYNTHLKGGYTDISSLQGLKIRYGGAIQTEILEALGATPVGGVRVTQIAESMSRGLVDGAILAWDSMDAFKVIPTVSTHIDVPLGFVPVVIGMNKDRWEALPDDLKAIMDADLGEPLARSIHDVVVRRAQEGIENAKSNGNTFVEISDADRAEWKERLEPVVENWLAEDPRHQELFDAYSDIIEQIAAESAG